LTAPFTARASEVLADMEAKSSAGTAGKADMEAKTDMEAKAKKQWLRKKEE